MIDAGLPIVQCLEILQGQTDNIVFSGILKDVKNSVEQGSTFSDSLRKHPKVFRPALTRTSFRPERSAASSTRS